MARVVVVLIFAVRAQSINSHRSIVASSAIIHPSTAARALSSYTRHYHCIAWRWVRLFNLQLSSNSHFTQHWKNGFFDRTFLHSLGLVCNLGHDSDPCPRESQHYDLTIIDVNGSHKVRVMFCTCDPETPLDQRYRQLLRMRWYPASFTRPRTAFSFDLLETYHKLTLQGKLNVYDFYLAVMQKSDNQGRSKPMVSNTRV